MSATNTENPSSISGQQNTGEVLVKQEDIPNTLSELYRQVTNYVPPEKSLFDVISSLQNKDKAVVVKYASIKKNLELFSEQALIDTLITLGKQSHGSEG